MKDIDLQAFEKWWSAQETGLGTAQKFTAWNAWLARAAVESDRAQRVPDGWKLVPVEPTDRMLNAASLATESEGMVTTPWLRKTIYFAMLASTPAQPAQQEPDCPRCNGSGEDPEGYFDQSRGPDGDTHDGPCRDCAGTGAAPQPVERKPMTDEQWKKKLGDRQLFTIMEAIRFVEKQYGIRE